MIRTSCNSLASMATVSRVCVCVSVPGDDVRKFMCMPQILCRFHGLHSQDWLRRQVEGAVGLQVEHDVTALWHRLDLDPEARQTHKERGRATRAGQNPFKPRFQWKKPQTDCDSLRTFSQEKAERDSWDFTGWTWIDFPLAPSACMCVIYHQVDFPFKPVIQHYYLGMCVRSSILRTHTYNTQSQSHLQLLNCWIAVVVVAALYSM